MLRRSSSARRKGQGLVEYGILIGGVALVALAAVSIFGHKITGLIGTTAAALPATHAEDAGAVVAGSLVHTSDVVIDGVTAKVLNVNHTHTFADVFGFTGTNNLVVEP